MYGGNDFGSGGGFMPMSSPRTGSQNSPGGERRAANQSLRPLTIKQIMKAEQAHSDAELYIDSIEIAQVTVVAQVISIVTQTTNSTYHIDDGTGRIDARLWIDSTTDENEPDNHGGIIEGTYVRVTGVLKHFGNKRYINATNIRPAKDPHELYFHLQEVVYVTLVHQRGPPTGSGDASRQNGASAPANGGSNANYSQYASASTAAANDQYVGVTPLARRIMEYINSEPTTEEGIHVAAIARAVKADAGAISGALDELMDNGHVFSTIDESHFAASG